MKTRFKIIQDNERSVLSANVNDSEPNRYREAADVFNGKERPLLFNATPLEATPTRIESGLSDARAKQYRASAPS